MNEKMLSKFVNEGGISKIGHAGYTLLSFIVEKAKEAGYPEVLELDIQETKFKCRIASNQHLKYVRDKLVEQKCVKDYQPNGQTGIFFLNYK